MLFTETHFLFYFLPFALLLHRLSVTVPSTKYRLGSCLCIFGVTLVFYGYQKPQWLIPFFICIGFDFLWATLLVRIKAKATRKWVVGFSVLQNVGLLGYFKYSTFLLSVIQDVFHPAWLVMPAPVELPPGISFYTFESLSFVIDVYRRDLVPPKRPWPFFAFIGMFPRFIAGPIVRYRDLAQQFEKYKGMQWEAGLYLFSLGFFAKACFADSFALLVPYAFGEGPISFFAAWVGALAYTFQIYFDFAGYSLMAIGLGRALGFQFPNNFNAPYQAQSFQEFWKRWHISLSTWLRDYLYISLGGSRHGKFRTYRNLFLTMLIGGLWHGAGYPFLIWGAWHGGLLVFERLVPFRKHLNPTANQATTFLAVVLGWVVFRAKNIEQAGTILKAMAGWGSRFEFNPTALQVLPLATMFVALGLVFVGSLEKQISFAKLEKIKSPSTSEAWFAVALFLMALLTVLSSFNVPFLYFQF